MAVRERINRVKIEQWRLSRVPIDPTETIFQGDELVWNTALRLATKATSGASAVAFIGISDTTNPIETIGSTRFLSDSSKAYVNVIQKGMVEMIVGANATYQAFDEVQIGQDAQSVIKGSTNPIGFADPGWTGGGAGKTVVAGDLIKIWLRVPKAYDSLGQT